MNHEELEAYKSETVWRLTADDIRMAVQDKYPNISEESLEELVAKSRHKLEIDWTVYVEAFADCYIEEEE